MPVTDHGTRAVSEVRGQPITVSRVPGREDKDPAGTARRAQFRDIALGIATPAALLLVWEVLGRRGSIDVRFWPPPSVVWEQARELVASGVLQTHLFASLRRVVLGYSVGAAIGIPMGLALGTSRILRATLEPMITALYTIPKLALLPLLLLILGLGEAPIIVVIAMTVFFLTAISTSAAVQTTPQGYLDAAVSFQANRFQRFAHVIVPAALPSIFVALRLSAGFAVLGYGGRGVRTEWFWAWLSNLELVVPLHGIADVRGHLGCLNPRRIVHGPCSARSAGGDFVGVGHIVSSISLADALTPRNVALMGVGRQAGSWGRRVIDNLQRFGFDGSISVVHPTASDIGGVPCYRTLLDVPTSIDHLMISLPSEAAIEGVARARDAGVRATTVMSSGFRDSGSVGAELEDRLARAAGNDMLLLGPNTNGFISFRPDATPVWATASTAFADLDELDSYERLPIAIVSQSGGVGALICRSLAERGCLPTYWVHLGNEALLSLPEAIAAFAEDDSISSIGAYIESVSDLKGFFESVRGARHSGTRMAAAVMGSTAVSKESARTHSGRMGAATEALKGIIRQQDGVICSDFAHLAPLLEQLAQKPNRPASELRLKSRGQRVAIVSASGGLGTQLSELCALQKLDLPMPSDALVNSLRQLMPQFASIRNPIDVSALAALDERILTGTIESIAESGEYDVLALAVGGMASHADPLADRIARLSSEIQVFPYWAEANRAVLQAFRSRGLAVHRSATDCARAIGARPLPQAESMSATEGARSSAPVGGGLEAGAQYSEWHLKRWLASFGMSVPSVRTIRNEDDLVPALRACSGRGYLKAWQPGVLHKAELGLVSFVDGIESAKAAYSRMLSTVAAASSGRTEICLESRIEGDVEMLFSIWNSAGLTGFTVGVGGWLSEAIRILGSRPFPLNGSDDSDVLQETGLSFLLDRYRGQEVLPVERWRHFLLGAASAAELLPVDSEIELNPVKIDRNGRLVVLDAIFQG
jgi:acetate---CoA ligase (ADP-forming)